MEAPESPHLQIVLPKESQVEDWREDYLLFALPEKSGLVSSAQMGAHNHL